MESFAGQDMGWQNLEQQSLVVDNQDFFLTSFMSSKFIFINTIFCDNLLLKINCYSL